jgi:hypothetical protein
MNDALQALINASRERTYVRGQGGSIGPARTDRRCAAAAITAGLA